MKFFIITVVSILLAYSMFADEIDYVLPPKPKTKKYVKVKRNGRWVDEEEM